MPRETRSERLDRLTALARKDGINLFQGVRNLPDYEKGLVLEANYRRRLQKIGDKYGKQVLDDLSTKLNRGVPLSDALIAVRDKLGVPMEEEYLREALDNTRRCMYVGWEGQTEHLQEGLDDDYRKEFKSASPAKRRSMPPPTKLKSEEYAKWELRPRVEEALSRRAGYCGDFYSVFFGSRKDDVVFFERMRDLMAEGAGVKEMVEKVDKALRETPDLDMAELTVREYGTRSKELTPGRLENIVRTEVQRALHVGQVERAKDSGLVVGFKFMAIEDDRTTIECVTRHGKLISIYDDEMVERCTPPLHYQCRSTLVALMARDWEEEGGDEQAEQDRMELENAPDFEWH